MNKKLYKEECAKMEYSALLIESLSLKETIGRLDDFLKENEKAYQDSGISFLYKESNEKAECYEKLKIVEDELKNRQKED